LPKIDSSVRFISLQFSFSNAKAVPGWISLHEHEEEAPQERVERKRRSSGEIVIKQKEKCSILGFVKDLGMAGYELIDAFCQKRINPKNPKGEMYQMVRFTFIHKEDMDLPDNFMSARIPALGNLREMCAVAMWRVRVFVNPFYKDGEMISDEHSMSINLEARTPLRTPDGPPIMIWPRNENGRSMKGMSGVEKVALAPDWRLRIKDNIISLVEA